MFLAHVRKTVAFFRGLALGVTLRLFGNSTALAARARSTLYRDMLCLVAFGSPYSALMLSRISGLSCLEAQGVLEENRQRNRQRWSAFNERRRQSDEA